MKKHRHWNWRFHLNLNLKTKKAVAVVAIALVIALLAGAGLYLLFQHKVRNTLSDVSEVPVTESPYVTIDGIKYVRDTSVKSYLFLGVDDVGLNYENYGRG